jgi:hypothetical protein
MASSEVGFLVLHDAHCIKSAKNSQIIPCWGEFTSANTTIGVRDDPIVSLVALFERFLVFSEDQKVVVFVNRIATVGKLKREFPSGIYIHSKCQDKDGLVNEFTKIKSQRVLIGTKLISNGIDVADVTKVVFFKHNSQPIDFIQGLGRFRGKGLCLMFNDKFVCPSLALSQLYDLPYRNHVCCCGAPIENEEVSDLYNPVVSANFETTQHDSEEEIQETDGGCTSPLVLPDFSQFNIVALLVFLLIRAHLAVNYVPFLRKTPLLILWITVLSQTLVVFQLKVLLLDHHVRFFLR